MKGEIIKSVETPGLGRKVLVDLGNAYELRCDWPGGARLLLTKRELSEFGNAMAVQAGIDRFMS